MRNRSLIFAILFITIIIFISALLIFRSDEDIQKEERNSNLRAGVESEKKDIGKRNKISKSKAENKFADKDVENKKRFDENRVDKERELKKVFGRLRVLIIKNRDEYDLKRLGKNRLEIRSLVDSLVELGKVSFDTLKEIYEGEDDVAVKKVLASVLGRVGNTEAVGILKESVEESSDNGLKHVAIDALCNIKMKNPHEKRVVAILLKSLNEDKKFKKRYLIPGYLAKMKDERAVESFEKLLKEDKDRSVRCHIVTALGNFKSKRSVRALKYCVENDDYEHVRINALNSLAKIATPEAAIEIIKRASYNDKSKRVRNLSLKLLKEFQK